MKFSRQKTEYSFKKAKHLLRYAFRFVRQKKKKLSPEIVFLCKNKLVALQEALLEKDRIKINCTAQELESTLATHVKKTGWDHLKELVFALGFALVVAMLVRQMWFELYEIPSGSMRPTFKEHDRLIVSKTDFGINIPLRPKEFYFDPELVTRNNIVIFTGENMDIRDVDTMYFYLFPGKKQYIKRLIGKPGDLLYFYGGLIYGIDQDGHDISPLLQLPMLDTIEHIPFIDFERKCLLPPAPVNGIYSPAFLYQMNEPVVKLTASLYGPPTAELIVPQKIRAPDALATQQYADLWGIKNYAMVRLLTPEQLSQFHPKEVVDLDARGLYLELRHHPNSRSVQLVKDGLGRLRPMLSVSTSYIPLQEEALKRLFKHLYTARFIVKGGHAFRYGADKAYSNQSLFSPELPNIPDGMYEFYDGIAYEILWQGITKRLPDTHPLYHFDPLFLQTLFNLGMEWDIRFSPQNKHQTLFPARYAYFRNGDLYLLGAPILSKEDPILSDFLKKERAKQEASSPAFPYQPFEDVGPPVKADGTLDIDLIKHNGLLIPQQMYLVLGDNHAMSSDSRDFGFVPASNLRGGPDLIFWPPGARWGTPLQPGYPLWNVPRAVVWVLATICIGGGILYWRRKNALPLKINQL